MHTQTALILLCHTVEMLGSCSTFWLSACRINFFSSQKVILSTRGWSKWVIVERCCCRARGLSSREGLFGIRDQNPGTSRPLRPPHHAHVSLNCLILNYWLSDLYPFLHLPVAFSKRHSIFFQVTVHTPDGWSITQILQPAARKRTLHCSPTHDFPQSPLSSVPPAPAPENCRPDRCLCSAPVHLTSHSLNFCVCNIWASRSCSSA